MDGTRAVIEGLAEARTRDGVPPILLSHGSAEIYGAPAPDDLPLTERSPLRPVSGYAQAKAAQEDTALRAGSAAGLRSSRSGLQPHRSGSVPDFAVPAFAARIVVSPGAGARRHGGGHRRPARPDRRARRRRRYRRLIELADRGGVMPEGLVVNVASGRSVLLRNVVAQLAAFAGWPSNPSPTRPSFVPVSHERSVGSQSIEGLDRLPPAIPLETPLETCSPGERRRVVRERERAIVLGILAFTTLAALLVRLDHPRLPEPLA